MEPPDAKTYRKRWMAWALYDVGNSAFYLIIVASVFKIFYQNMYVELNTLDSSSLTKEELTSLKTQGGALLGFTDSIAMAVVAILGPILGTLADRYRAKKKFLAGFAALGVVASGLMVLIAPTDLLFASILYAIGMVGVAGSIVFYDSLLPGVAREDDVDRISTIGFAAGYAGSVLLFILVYFIIQDPGTFGLSDGAQAARVSFLLVAIWWAVFTIPLLRHVEEPETRTPDDVGGNPILAGFRQLGRTLRTLPRHRELFAFLIAFWIYIDGVGTIIKMAAPFGNSVGVGDTDLIMALIITQVVGVPCALGFGRLSKLITARNAILLGLGVYAAICFWATAMEFTWHFYAMAIGVGMVQGGVQALSRSVFASMIPKGRSAEYFGFFSATSKFAGIVGPLVLGLFWSSGDDPRPGILFLAIFFVVGGFLLWRVDVDAGRRAAREGG